MPTPNGENGGRDSMDMGCLSRQRGAVMGFAILIVVLFHVSLPRSSSFYGLCRLGNVGVDIFLFVSGMGLWFAWQKSQELRHYYARRFRRIYPTWLIVGGAFYVWQYPSHKFSQSLVDLGGDILINWDFWLHDELTFWYVPAIMALYIVAPLFLAAMQRNRDWAWTVVLMVLWCVAVQWVTPIHQAVGHIEIFWSRVPIFFVGIVCGEAVRQKRALSRSTIWVLCLLMAASLVLSWWLEQYRHGQFPLFVERMVYIPLTVAGCILLSLGFERLPQWAQRPFVFIGGISLEIYLLHSNFFLTWIRPLHLGYWGTSLVVLACTIPVAWILQKAVGKVIR